jgi:hypothetical protein
MWDVGRTNLDKQQRAMSIMLAELLPILSRVIGVLIAISAATWYLTGASALPSGSPQTIATKIAEVASAQVKLHVRIEVDVFSGRENPSWELSEKNARELVSLLREKNERLNGSPSPESLGFRGFRIVVKENEHEQRFHTSGSAIESQGVRLLDRGNQVTKFILATMPSELKEEFADVLPH